MNKDVLCVDDEEDYQILVQRILSRIGLRVHVAETGEAALAMMRHLQPDILLLDINLPDTNGYELCTSVRKSLSAAELPIIMLTVRRRPEEWMRGFSCGANDYIAKPINPPLLTDRVLYHLEEKTRRATPHTNPEYLLIQAAVAGNRSAFDVLVEKYRKRLVESLANSIRNETYMEDVISHTLATALERLPEFRGESAFFTWLYRIAMNEYITYFRKPAPLSLDAVLESNTDHIVKSYEQEHVHEDLLATREIGHHALEALDTVPQPYRKVLELYCLSDLSYESIARRLRIPEGTVMSRLYKARKLLQDAWSKTPASLTR